MLSIIQKLQFTGKSRRTLDKGFTKGEE